MTDPRRGSTTAMRTENWKTITHSRYVHDRKGLDFIRQRHSDQEPLRTCSNFEFVSDSDDVHEVDPLVLTRMGLFLVEIKELPGRVVGGRANAAPTDELGRRLDMRVTSDNFVVKFPPLQSFTVIEHQIRHLAAVDPGSLRVPDIDSARDELMFAECLPVELANRVIQERLGDPEAIAATLARTTRVINADKA